MDPVLKNVADNRWPEDVGIKAIEFVFPMEYVDQIDLAEFDKVDPKKYTEGLGQKQMGFCSDLEDINSLCLTALNKLMDKHNLKYEDIGRIDVGTETVVDKSKSVKTVLMDLFKDSGNFNIEGLDTTNACYGGTAALFNALNWIESSYWDGRLAIVIAGDIAVYAEGNARPTGGAGAVAMLIGPHAPIVVDRGLRSTYMAHVYDFYKPDLTSEYPIVDGKLSIQCYLSALDTCYKMYRDKTKDSEFCIDKLDAMVFHSPYCKLVRKSVGRLLFNDFVLCKDKQKYYPELEHLKDVKLEDTYFDREIENLFMSRSQQIFDKMTKKSLLLASRVGNMYTASVYSCLSSYLAETPIGELPGKRIGIFSYGSGLASSMYSVKIKGGPHLEKLISSISNIENELNSRKKVTAQEFSDILKKRSETLHDAPFTPSASTDTLFPGTWYLSHIDEKHRRKYARKV